MQYLVRASEYPDFPVDPVALVKVVVGDLNQLVGGLRHDILKKKD